MQPLHRQRTNHINVLADAVKIGGQQQFAVTLQCVIRRLEGFAPRLRQLQCQSGFINLYPFDAALCQFRQHLLIDRQNLPQQRQTFKRLTLHFPQPQIRHRPQQHWLDVVSQRQCLIHLVQQLGPGQFKRLTLGKFRHHVVIVGVKPFGHFCRRRRLTGRRTTASQAEQGVEVHCACFVLMTHGHVAQHQAGGQHMVIPGKIADRQQIDTRLFLLLPVSRTQLTARRQ